MIKQKAWTLFHGYINPDWVESSEYIGSKETFDQFVDAYEFCTHQINKIGEVASKGMYAASTMPDPTAIVDVNVHYIYKERELIQVITTDDSPFYFCRIIFGMSTASNIVKIANAIEVDQALAKMPMAKYHIMDYFYANFFGSHIVYDNGRWFNDDTELWACPHCKVVYDDFSDVTDAFEVTENASLGICIKHECGGIMVLGEQDENPIKLALERINSQIDSSVVYTFNGIEYKVFLQSTTTRLHQRHMSPTSYVATTIARFLFDNDDSNKIDSVKVSRVKDGAIQTDVDTSILLFESEEVGQLLAILCSIDYGLTISKSVHYQYQSEQRDE